MGCSKHQLNVDSIFRDSANLRANHTDEQFKLLLRKGVYPYEYMTSWDKFDETKLPPKEAFYSNLNMRGISNHNYEHAKRVWKAFNMRNLGEYHNRYLKTDILLLSNIFKAFRNTCLIRLISVHHLDWLGKLV